jgi:hypothetical protein
MSSQPPDAERSLLLVRQHAVDGHPELWNGIASGATGPDR